MAAKPLEQRLRDTAEQFTRELIKAGFPVTLAAYVYREDLGDWRFVLETPLIAVDSVRETYDRIIRFAKVMRQADMLDEVQVLVPGSPFARDLQGVIEVKESSGQLSGLTINGRAMPSMWLFHSSRPIAREPAKRARRSFDRRLEQLEAA